MPPFRNPKGIIVTGFQPNRSYTKPEADAKFGGGGVTLLTTKGDLFGFSNANARVPVGADGTVLSSDSTQTTGLKWITVSGTGTVTATAGSLTANAIVLGAGTTDTKVAAGITTDGTSMVTLGVNTTTLGKLKLFGNTSGDVTLQPNAVAGTGIVLTLPSTTGTLVTGGGTASGTNTGDQTTVSGNAGTATALQNARTIGGVSFDGTANITVATATGGFTVSGGALALGANNLTMTGSLAATGARVTKGWFTDIESTNMPTVGGTAILTSLTAPQFTTIELGAASDTTLSRVSAGVIAVEGVNVLLNGGALGTPSSGTGTNITGIPAANILAGTFGTGSYTIDTRLTVPQLLQVDNAVTASANATTLTRANRNNVVTNNSAATLTITLSTTSATAGDMLLVQVLDFSAVAQTITWVNTENSTATAPTTSNGSTTLPISAGFKWNAQTSKWRCVAAA